MIIGYGDLGLRIAQGVISSKLVDHLVLVGRDTSRGASQTRLLAACGTGATQISFHQADALDPKAVRQLLKVTQPALVVQSASLLSPWFFHERQGPIESALAGAGFAAQLCAQLPIIHRVMEAVRDINFCGDVINCSYPDVTHPILHALGLAPSVGIGNAGMILQLAQAAAPNRALRVFAHHGHMRGVTSAILGSNEPGMQPWVYDADDPVPFGALPALLVGEALPRTRALNALSASHALRVIAAMLPGGRELVTSVPGPNGLPGGWPVRIESCRVKLNLPFPLRERHELVLQYQRQAARLDGIENIAADGEVEFTSNLADALPDTLRSLIEPMRPNDALKRWSLLSSELKGES